MKITLSVSKDTKKSIDLFSKAKGMSKSAYVADLVERDQKLIIENFQELARLLREEIMPTIEEAMTNMATNIKKYIDSAKNAY